MKTINEFIKFYITPEMSGLRIDKAASQITEIGSRARAQYLIDHDCILINKKKPKASQILNQTDLLEIKIPQATSHELVPTNIKLDILFEDDDIIVINKPAGLVVHPAAGHVEDTLVNGLLAHTKNLSMKFNENRPGIVHRIDKETSGILVVAKNDLAHEHLAQQFKNRTVHRIYYAVCFSSSNITTKNSGKITSYLSRHPIDRKRYASLKNKSGHIINQKDENITSSKWASTNYEILNKSEAGFSYFKLKLDTGRTHQIRVHLSELGYPIVGDKLYGADKKINSIKNQAHKALLKQLTRFFLHAAELGFIHPKTNDKLFFQTDWPEEDFKKIQELGIQIIK